MSRAGSVRIDGVEDASAGVDRDQRGSRALGDAAHQHPHAGLRQRLGQGVARRVRTDRGDEMFAVMAERPARQALELGSLGLLEPGSLGLLVSG